MLWLLGSTLVDVYLYGTRKIPFTCSYLPGKSTFQAMFWVSLLFLFLLTAVFGLFERQALDFPVLRTELPLNAECPFSRGGPAKFPPGLRRLAVASPHPSRSPVAYAFFDGHDLRPAG